MRLIFATRPSALARWQTQWVMTALQQAHPRLQCEARLITTQGDKILDRPLPEIGGKGLFTRELEAELLRGTVHCAVHSFKDLPVADPAGLTVGCVPARADVRDALVSARGYTLADLPPGAAVGTSSLRRAAQLLAARPDLSIQSLRGNVDSRVRKALDADTYDAVVLAGAGLTRLGLEQHVSHWLPLDVMLPAPAQGALAVQCRVDDAATLELLAALESAPARACATAERAFLAGLGGGCAVPVAAYAHIDGQPPASIHLTGLVIAPTGERAVKCSGAGSDALTLGRQLAQDAVARGANDILSALTVK